jgi:hypothetical protein
MLMVKASDFATVGVPAIAIVTLVAPALTAVLALATFSAIRLQAPCPETHPAASEHGSRRKHINLPQITSAAPTSTSKKRGSPSLDSPVETSAKDSKQPEPV